MDGVTPRVPVVASPLGTVCSTGMSVWCPCTHASVFPFLSPAVGKWSLSFPVLFLGHGPAS